MPKFRIWDKEYKRWANPVLFALDASGELTWTTRFNPPPKSKDDLIIQMSTGLMDDVGKEIFENDIISYYKGEEILSVQYCEEYAKFGALIILQEGVETSQDCWRWFDELLADSITVIGNGLQNPELLQSKPH